MDLAALIYECGELAVRSLRQDSDYKNLINRAQKTITERRNWTFMHDMVEVSVASGETSAILPATFKQLTGERTPVSLTYDSYRLPVKVVSRAEIESRGIWPWIEGTMAIPTPGTSYPVRVVFIERRGGDWTLNVPPQLGSTTTMEFNVSAYFHMPELDLGSDHNALTDHGELADALVNLAKAKAFFAEDPESTKGVAAMALYEDAFQKAAYSDAGAAIGGRTWRM